MSSECEAPRKDGKGGVDADTAMNCVMEFDDPACVIVKHVNPCGVATGADLNNAYEKSFETDPESAFGGVIAVNGCVDKTFASTLIEKQFVEVLIAPDFSEEDLIPQEPAPIRPKLPIPSQFPLVQYKSGRSK